MAKIEQDRNKLLAENQSLKEKMRACSSHSMSFEPIFNTSQNISILEDANVLKDYVPKAHKYYEQSELDNTKFDIRIQSTPRLEPKPDSRNKSREGFKDDSEEIMGTSDKQLFERIRKLEEVILLKKKHK